MLTPLSDKSAIKAIIDTDDFIINELGFEPKDVLTYGMSNDEVTSESKYIFIILPSTPSSNSFNVDVVYRIEVLAASKIQGDAIRASQRILELLDQADIGNNHILDIYSGVEELTAPKSTVKYAVSVRFQTPVNSIITK